MKVSFSIQKNSITEAQLNVNFFTAISEVYKIVEVYLITHGGVVSFAE